MRKNTPPKQSTRNRHTGRVNHFVKDILKRASAASPQRQVTDSKGQRYAYAGCGYQLGQVTPVPPNWEGPRRNTIGTVVLA